ncbi:MAG: DNA-binding protein WhiA [Ruminococcus sp.]|nr:DNA-binding protein WhiA [Ruminococcus sp.]
MSFSNDVRREISSSVNDKDKRFACLYGMLLFSRTLSHEKICFQTESKISADMFKLLIYDVFGKSAQVKAHTSTRKNGAELYSFDIDDRDAVKKILGKYRISAAERGIDSEIIVNNSLGVFAAGVFLACGSVNNPSKEYHLEFTVPERHLAEELLTLLGDIGVNAKIASRRGQFVVYIKESESIEDTLTFIGAQQCTLELMNVKIYKDVRNKANRIANCDTANIDKVVNAAIRQIEDIQLIDRNVGIENLPDELREIAEIRLANTDMSLKEIGDSLENPISRSGVNHRFKRLAKMADEIRTGGADKNES